MGWPRRYGLQGVRCSFFYLTSYTIYMLEKRIYLYLTISGAIRPRHGGLADDASAGIRCETIQALSYEIEPWFCPKEDG